MAFMKKLKAQ